MTTIDTLMALADDYAEEYSSAMVPQTKQAAIEARAALLTALQENDGTTKSLVRELRYIEGISQGQVKRIASSALESMRAIDTSQ